MAISRQKITWLVLLVYLFLTSIAVACPYTVRDVGFIDFSQNHYYFYAYVDSTVDPVKRDLICKKAKACFVDTNIDFTLVDVENEPDHPGFIYLSGLPDSFNYPFGMMVSATGETFPLETLSLPDSFDQTVDSPTRTNLLRLLPTHACVILLAPGADTMANEKARAMINHTISELIPPKVESAFDKPVLLELSQEEVTSEKLLLWSLGITIEELQRPLVTVLYGKGHRLGDVYQADMIDSSELLTLIKLVYASCECDLDKRWFSKNPIPMRWDAANRTLLAQTLQFDPDNPIVKIEVSQILGGGVSSDAGPLAYAETDIDIEGTESEEQKVSISGSDTETSTATATRTQRQFYILVAVVAFMILVNTVTAFWIWAKARSRKQQS